MEIDEVGPSWSFHSDQPRLTVCRSDVLAHGIQQRLARQPARRRRPVRELGHTDMKALSPAGQGALARWRRRTRVTQRARRSPA